MAGTPMFPPAVTTEMLWHDVPCLDRVRRNHELGFQVEMWDWTRKDLDAIAANLDQTRRNPGVVGSRGF